MNDPTLTITHFDGLKEIMGKRHDVTWSKLCDVLRCPKESPDIDSLPLIKFSLLPHNSRKAGTIPENMTAVIGDYDGEVISVDEALERLKKANIAAAVYTTRRHRPDAPRWRVIVQFSMPVSCAEYGRYLDIINGSLGGILAPESWDIKRSYFYGKVKGVEYRFEQVSGLPIDIKVQSGVEWEAVGKQSTTSMLKSNETAVIVPENDREFERAIVLNELTDRTIHDLQFALEAIWNLADDRSTWNEVFLAAVSMKGTNYEDQARALIESWSQKYSVKWGVKEDDTTKWDREIAREITYKSIFQLADNQPEQHKLTNTALHWRALANTSWEEKTMIAKGSNIMSFAEFSKAMEPPTYIWHRVLQKGCLYALTAKWGHGKTALMVSVAMHVATGRDLGGHQVKAQRVLYLCGENPADVQLRISASVQKFGIKESELDGQIFFTRRPFALDKEVELKQFLHEAIVHGPFGLAVIDTGPAHSCAQEENDNREMHKLAMSMRDLMEPLGNPATVALMHPTKEASHDNLQPRGGGAFSGSIDGELCAWQEQGNVEFFHRTKFRGPGFDPMWFSLERYELPGMQDNFGEPVSTVLAVEANISAADYPARSKPLTRPQTIAHKALEAAMSDLKSTEFMSKSFGEEAASALSCMPPETVVTLATWRAMTYNMGISDGDFEAKKKAFKRARDKLVELGLVKIWKDMCWIQGVI